MKILVTAASRHGATREIAEAIAARLTERGHAPTVTEAVDVTDLDGFDAVVLGSAIYAGRWLGPARELVDRLADQLATRPVWLFSSGPIGDPPQPDEDPAEVADVIEAIGARGHQRFAGKLDRTELGWVERGVVRALKAPEGDFRDWPAIEAWTDEIAYWLTRQAA